MTINRPEGPESHNHEEEARITFGGDEFIFVEVHDEMSLRANFKVTSFARELHDRRVDGIVDICPANASLLVRIDPLVVHPFKVVDILRDIESSLASEVEKTIKTRIIEIPVWYDDPFTSEVEAKFREGYHQEPSGSDLDYAAKINGLADKAAFIETHHSSPWLVSMVGFVAGLPFMFQLVERERQLEVPKYLSPRTDTPKLTVGHGGCFACIYSVRGAGGYQMFGVAAAPIYDPSQTLPDFQDFLILFRPGDIVKFRPIEEAEYQDIQQRIADNTFRYKIADVEFDIEEALANPDAHNQKLLEALDENFG
ncbi:allophanate hydrolase subunit 1 [Staphylococcus chromogenes]|nr:allophanate hydrolase subunit 1 [Staphylococcus chromogenes]